MFYVAELRYYMRVFKKKCLDQRHVSSPLSSVLFHQGHNLIPSYRQRSLELLAPQNFVPDLTMVIVEGGSRTLWLGKGHAGSNGWVQGAQPQIFVKSGQLLK